MDYIQMKQWLDALVDNLEEQERLVYYNSRISTYEPDRAMFLHGVEEAADIMGIELRERELPENPQFSCKFEYSFIYRDVKFMNYFDERIERFAGADRKSDGCR